MNMKTKINKNGTVSVYGMTMAQYNAINNILLSSEGCFDEEENGEYKSNDDFVCTLTEEEKEAMDEIGWSL